CRRVVPCNLDPQLTMKRPAQAYAHHKRLAIATHNRRVICSRRRCTDPLTGALHANRLLQSIGEAGYKMHLRCLILYWHHLDLAFQSTVQLCRLVLTPADRSCFEDGMTSHP